MRPVRRRSRDSGSVLMLVPAGLLVLLLLGAISVDSAVVFLASRDLSNRTAAAANDVATAAVDDVAFYGRGTVSLDPRRADLYVALAFADERRPSGYRSWGGEVVTSGRIVTVTATAEVDHVFARAIPGVARSTTVRARSVASVRGG